MPKKDPHFTIVILAGGGGTRLWPRSRTQKPKQFLKLINTKTLLRETYERLAPLVPPGNMYVTTVECYEEAVAKELPEIPRDHILVEPYAKSTAIAIGMAAMVISRKDPRAVIGTFASDHTLKAPARFRSVVKAMVAVCSSGKYLGTIGITPTRPHTGYGYIHLGNLLTTSARRPVYRVKEFVEKPDQTTAERYLAQDSYVWNASYFFFTVDTIRAAFAKYMPHLHTALTRIHEAWGTPQWSTVLAKVYSQLAQEPIEYGIFEKADNVIVARGDFEWSDIGDWATIYDLLHKRDGANVVVSDKKTPLVALDTEGCLVSGNGRLIAAIGLKDFVVVDSDDALLLCPIARTQEVRKIVETLKKHHRMRLV